MKGNQDLKECIEKSVLCWLATASAEGVPNVSPKECYAFYGDNTIIVANIASPQTVRNIGQNPNVCVGFLDILVQKGCQIHGKAEIIKKTNPSFEGMFGILDAMTQGRFPFNSITKISIERTKPIIAPSYLLYPDTTEREQIENSKRSYGL